MAAAGESSVFTLSGDKHVIITMHYPDGKHTFLQTQDVCVCVCVALYQIQFVLIRGKHAQQNKKAVSELL